MVLLASMKRSMRWRGTGGAPAIGAVATARLPSGRRTTATPRIPGAHVILAARSAFSGLSTPASAVMRTRLATLATLATLSGP